MATKCCAVCGKTSDEVRLYRDYAEGGNLRDRDIWCNEHVREDKGYVVPCVVRRRDGNVWATFPPSGSDSGPDFNFWWSQPEADPNGWTRPMRAAA